MSEVLQFRDSPEKEWTRRISRQAEIALDTAGFSAYVYQRGNVGLSVDEIKMMGFMGWSMDRIDEVERMYQEELK